MADLDPAWSVIVPAFFIAIPATIAAVAGLRNGQRAIAAKDAAEATRTEFREAVADGNGGQQIGRAVHDIGQTVEVLSAQTHTNTQELLALTAKLDTHIEEAAPLTKWVRTQIAAKQIAANIAKQKEKP